MGTYVGGTSGIASWCSRHPLGLVIAAALVIRLVLMPLLTYDYDIYHWGVIIQNFQSGNGLYEVAGYYYTPTWGYILGSVAALMDAVGAVDVFGIRFADLFPIEDLVFDFHTATTTTIAFNIAMKAPLVVCDIAVALLIRWFILEFISDDRKALAGAVLWLFCPTIIYMSGVQAQFDTLSALMMLLTVALVYRRHYLIGGAIFSAAVLLKFFPAFTIIVLVAYILVRHRGDGTGVRRVLEAAVGAAVMCVVLLLPQILDGTLEYTLGFVIGRMDMQADNGILVTVGQYALNAIAVIGMVYSGYRMARYDGEGVDRKMLECVLLALCFAMFMSAVPQYMMVMLPVLIVVMLVSEGRLRICWILIAAGSIIGAVANNNIMLLDSASEFLGVVSPEWVVSAAEWIESFTIFGQTIVTIVNALGSVLEYIGFIILVLLVLERGVSAKLPKMGRVLSRLKRWDFDREEI